MGQEERTRRHGRVTAVGFGQGTFAGTHRNGQDAPNAVLGAIAIERTGSTHGGPFETSTDTADQRSTEPFAWLKLQLPR